MASIIKKRADDLSQGAAGSVENLCDNNAPPGRRLDAASALAAAVSAKIEDGNIRAAVRIVCSEDKPAPDNGETYAKLLEKHPVSSSGGTHPYVDPRPAVTFQASEADVLKAIRSFPAGSCGGPDRIRPKHIADMVNCRE